MSGIKDRSRGQGLRPLPAVSRRQLLAGDRIDECSTSKLPFGLFAVWASPSPVRLGRDDHLSGRRGPRLLSHVPLPGRSANDPPLSMKVADFRGLSTATVQFRTLVDGTDRSNREDEHARPDARGGRHLRLRGALAGHPLRRQSAQLGVHDRKQFGSRAGISALDRRENTGHIRRRFFGHHAVLVQSPRSVTPARRGARPRRVDPTCAGR